MVKASPSYLLPGTFKIPGSIFTLLGAATLIARFYLGIRPDWLELKVFAIYSAYLDVKYMSVIQNQLAEEIGGFFLFTGLYMLAFSREKNETKQLNHLRFRGFMITMWVNACFILMSLAFTYGLGFAFMMMIDSIFFIVVYIIVFRVLIYRSRKTDPTET